MSEHMSITGKINFQHSPMEEEGSFSYCHHCKVALRKLTLELHQGICTDWIQAICHRCNKTIWVAELSSNEEENPKSFGNKIIIKDKNKCVICGKETNRWDCMSYSYTAKGRIKCTCSVKCFEEECKRKK